MAQGELVGVMPPPPSAAAISCVHGTSHGLGELPSAWGEPPTRCARP